MGSTGNSSRRAFLGGIGAGSVASLAGAATLATTTTTARARPLAAEAKSGSDSAVVPPLAIRALHRMGYGPARRRKTPQQATPPGSLFRSGFEVGGQLGQDDVGYFNSLGSTDDERLANYVEQQLNPAAIPDTDLNQRMAAYPSSFALLNQPLATTWGQRECDPDFDDYVRPYREVEKAAFTRAVYSNRQLFELIAEFWHMHFNVYAPLDRDTYVSWASWDRDVIRQHAFGNFYEMVHASARHPTMLRYLDNYANGRGGFNENYARELFELHTMGAENYRGLDDLLTVELLPENPYTALNDAELNNASLSNGLAIANPTRQIARYYVDYHVYEAAKALTGWRYHDPGNDSPPNCGTGAFMTNEADHENSGKTVLSNLPTMSPDQGAELDGRLAIKMAAYHPGTATYIARKLCRRLISDDPPESIVQAAAATFYQHRKSPDQIKRTLRTILNSAEFKDPALWGQKTKRPFEYVVSAMRAAGCNHTFRQDDSTASSGDFLNVFNQSGHRLFYWRTPDGYPDKRKHWQGSNGLVQCWRAIDWLTDRNANNSETRVMRILDLTWDNIPGNPTARQVVEFWCEWIMGFAPAGGWTGPVGTPIANAPTQLGRAALGFFCQTGFAQRDRNLWPADDEPIPRADLGVNSGGNDWYTRLRGLVALILWSPNFMQR